LEIWVVGIGDSISVGVGILAIVRVCWILVYIVGLAVTIGVGIIGICSLGIFLGIGKSIAIRVCIGISTVGGVEAIGNFPSVG
jgi:hypothetical protein